MAEETEAPLWTQKLKKKKRAEEGIAKHDTLLV
jgi:hypothetical protein